jgi:hypothetical protein
MMVPNPLDPAQRKAVEEFRLGDLVAEGTKALGVKPCGKCRKRQAWLNRVTPGWMKKFLSWVKSL